MGHKLKCSEVAVMEGVNIRTINVRCKSNPPYYPTAVCIGHRWYIDSDDPKLGSGIMAEIPNQGEPKNEPKTSESQTIKEETVKIQAETSKINAQITYEEAQGRRDKPSRLAEREVGLNNRENAISNREVSLETREADFTARLQDLETKEAALKTRKDEADDYYKQKVKEGDAVYLTKEKQAELMETTLNSLQQQINDLDQKILLYPDKLAPIREELEQLISVSNQWGNHQYSKAVITDNPVYQKRSDRFFDLSDMLKKIKEWMG